MDASKLLRDYLNNRPEHPVPYAGDIVQLTYPPKDGTVGVALSTRSDLVALFTVTVPAGELPDEMALAERAVARSAGLEADAPDAVASARAKLGDAVFDERVGSLARLAFLSAAMLRTGVFPFLSSEILTNGPIPPGEDYTFQARMVLRPSARLSDAKAPAVARPKVDEVTEDDIDFRMNQIVGGNIPWNMVSPERSESLTALRAQVREAIEAERDAARRDAITSAAADELARRLDREAPNVHIELLRDSMANSFASDLVANGVDWDAYSTSPGFSMADFKTSMTMNAITSIRRGMALDALAEAVGIKLDVDDVIGAVGQIAPGSQPDSLDDMLLTGQIPQLIEVSRRLKASDWLVRNCRDA